MGQVIFFDFANTLAHKKDLYPTITGILQKTGYPVDVKTVQLIQQELYEEIIFPDQTDYEFYMYFNAELLQRLGIEPDKSLCEKIYYACKPLRWVLYDDCKVLYELSQPLGILSNFNSQLKMLVHRLFPENLFRWIIVSAEESIRKPDPLFYQLILKKTGFLPEDIIYVGDSVKLDYEPAVKMGLKALLVDRERVKNGNVQNRIESLSDLKNYI